MFAALRRFSYVWMSIAVCGIACAFIMCSEIGKADDSAPGNSTGSTAIAAPVNYLPLLFFDSFSSGTADNWEATDSNAWRVVRQNGQFVYNQFQASKVKTPVRSPFNRSMIKDITVGSFTFDVRLQSTIKDYGHRDLCLFFGYQDPAHFYYVHLGKKTDDHANNIFIVNGAPRTKISTTTSAGTNWDDSWHRARIVRDASSGTIRVYFDDMREPVMTATDATFPWGQVGVGSFDDTGNFDNVFLFGETVDPRLQPVTLDNVVTPGPNTADSPFAKKFSMDRAARFLDTVAVKWQKQRKCFTCHTNFAYLYARPSIGTNAPAHNSVRKFAEQLVGERWPDKGPRWDAEIVASAAALAFNDSETSGKLHPLTRIALDRMWTVQRDDGGWDWLKCGWPPMESDDHYGATLAAIAVGVAPDDYPQSEAAQKGIQGLRKYFKANPPPTLHHQAMLLWASSYLDGLMTPAEKQACIKKLLVLQKPDGGWGLATLGDWKRADEKEQDLKSSDGYGTGFVLYALRRAGVSVKAPQIQRGVAWLKSHQRESGHWFTRSLNKDSRHFISHAGTAFAVMALAACEETDIIDSK